jgi:hypothetical protein
MMQVTTIKTHDMNLKICNNAGKYKECRNCPGNKPNRESTLCPISSNWNLTKVIGTLGFSEGRFYLENMFGGWTHIKVVKSDFPRSKHVGKEVVAFLTDKGFEILRLKE